MVRIVLGVIVGFLVWSVLWVGSDQVLMMIWPEWYGAHQLAFERAMTNKEPFAPDLTILMMHLVRSVIVSLISGFIAAVTAAESRRTTLILGVLLLLVGLAVEIMAWNYLPIWYHFLFLFLIVPMTIAGGKLRSANSA